MNSSDAPAAIRVRSIPAGHDYVRHAVGSAPGIVLLDDPLVDPADPSQWWPHPALEAAERPEVLDGADLVHVHFGYEHRTPDQVAGFVSAVRGRALPLVVTVHDLRNPHEADPAEALPDPDWPASFYAETDDLTRGTGQWRVGLWRGVISAVMGLHRRLYDAAGGFDPGIVGYGGEDWDMAWRCEQAGGRFRYVPEAVAWHDGPDWGGRGVDDPHHLAQKNTESARLAPLVASPLTRPAGGVFAVPLVAVHLHAPGSGGGGSATSAGSGSPPTSTWLPIFSSSRVMVAASRLTARSCCRASRLHRPNAPSAATRSSTWSIRFWSRCRRLVAPRCPAN